MADNLKHQHRFTSLFAVSAGVGAGVLYLVLLTAWALLALGFGFTLEPPSAAPAYVEYSERLLRAGPLLVVPGVAVLAYRRLRACRSVGRGATTALLSLVADASVVVTTAYAGLLLGLWVSISAAFIPSATGNQFQLALDICGVLGFLSGAALALSSVSRRKAASRSGAQKEGPVCVPHED